MSTKYPVGSTPIAIFNEEAKKGKSGLPLRKSCQFCRSRKIRCSGHSICNACRERNIECSYGACGQKGRTRGPTRPPSQENFRLNSRTPTPSLDTFNSRRNSEGQMLGQFHDSKIDILTPSVAVRLEDMFIRLMGYASEGRSNHADQLLDRLSERISTSNMPHISAQNHPPKPLSYDTVFSTFAPDLIEIVSSRFHHFDYHGLDLSRSRNGTQYEILVAAMLADVQYGQRNEPDYGEGGKLFNWITLKLQEIAEDEFSLSAIQAVILLGWRCLCFGNARRALCYLFWAEEALYSLPTPQTGVNTINGIDVGKIEQESYRNASWLVFFIKLWAMLQLNITGYESPPPGPPPSISTDESSLQSFKLDRASHNLATLQTQERMYREMCLLGHVTYITGRVLATYTPEEKTDRPRIYQSSNSQPNQGFMNMPNTCLTIHAELLGSFPSLKNDLQYSTGYHHGLALCASHTLLIHSLVYKMNSDVYKSTTNSTHLIAMGSLCQPILDFCASAKSLLEFFSTFHNTDYEGANTSSALMSQQLPNKHDLLALSLNACGQAMNTIYIQGQNGTEMVRNCIRENASELARLATELRAFSKDFCFISTRLKGAKKLPKNAIYQFTAPQMGLSGSYTSASTPSRMGSLKIPEAELNAAFDHTDFSFGYDHASYSVAGFHGYGLPMMSDNGYNAGNIE
ncbi:hypothetical protein HYALB_00004705 [Hymenoscyphus albidus]|uniref:Zn(2)-C6 fungal-type domain-containing protein n=1 Tax=Hymenoscyphus albidus TaxID=595503 RepID=A0A9N9Q0T3_9HELO|nr:hypothetical protein HYALB_00004705 [Hymenoscyphus albidus]